MTLHWWPKMCCTVGAQKASVSCLRLMKPEIFCGKGLIHPFGGRSAQLNVLAVCGFPVTALDEVSQSDRGQVEVRRNTLIGRGFHLPSIIALVTIMALEVIGASTTLRTDLSYGPAELFLRRRVHGTVFQPGAFYSFPGMITARALWKMFFFSLIVKTLPWHRWLRHPLRTLPCTNVQLYWIDTQLRGLPSFSQGPQWRSQVRRGRTQPTQARQKITVFGRFGIGYLIPPGSGKREHLRLSAQLKSPSSLVGDVDDDTEFVAVGQALLGPYISTFRRLQEKSFETLGHTSVANSRMAAVQEGRQRYEQ